MSSRPIAAHTITQQDARDVLVVLALRKADQDLADIPDWRTWLIQAMAEVPDDETMQRFERGFEGTASAVRLVLLGGKQGLDRLQDLAFPGPF